MNRNLSLLVCIMAAALVAGCESVSDATGAVRARLAAREEVRTKNYPATTRAVFEAVRVAAVQMGYRVVRAGAAQGEVEAISGVRAGETHGSARQVEMKVKLRAVADGQETEVAARFVEIVEPDSSNRAGQATAMPLRDTPQYEVLFQRVGQILAASAAAP